MSHASRRLTGRKRLVEGRRGPEILHALSSHSMLCAQGLKAQARVVSMSRVFVEGARLAKLTEEQVEQIWRAALSPEAGAGLPGPAGC